MHGGNVIYFDFIRCMRLNCNTKIPREKKMSFLSFWEGGGGMIANENH